MGVSIAGGWQSFAAGIPQFRNPMFDLCAIRINRFDATMDIGWKYCSANRARAALHCQPPLLLAARHPSLAHETLSPCIHQTAVLGKNIATIMRLLALTPWSQKLPQPASTSGTPVSASAPRSIRLPPTFLQVASGRPISPAYASATSWLMHFSPMPEHLL